MAQKLRVPLGFVIAAAVLYFAVPTKVSILVGLPVAILGGVFRGLAAGVIRKDASLASSGVYALTRNPLYFGTSLLVTGFAIMSSSEVAAALLLVPFALIYPSVMVREEEHLLKLFPDEFRTYKRKVPRFFPRITFPSALSFSFPQYLANREYNTALGLAGALGIFVLKAFLR